MTRRVASRAAVDPFLVMEVIRAAGDRDARTGDVLHLEVGQPSTGAPTAAVDAARAALDAPELLGYTDANGMQALRQAISRHYANTAAVTVDAAHVVVTTGASAAIVLAVLAAFDVGDRVAVCEPGYPCYRQILTALGCIAVPVRIDDTDRFQPTPAHLDRAADDPDPTVGPLAGLIIASPSNPTGSVLTTGELAAISQWCDDRGVRLISDEIYHGITYDLPAPTALRHASTRPVVINSFSKYFSMTGWRLGWMVVPPELVRPIELLAQNLMIAPPTISQVAAMGAFNDPAELDTHVGRYRLNRATLVDGLRRLGIERIAPAQGAFYLYADVSPLLEQQRCESSTALARRWLDELGVAVTPGVDFDPIDGDHWMRFSYAGSTADVEAAVERLRASAA